MSQWSDLVSIPKKEGTPFALAIDSWKSKFFSTWLVMLGRRRL